MTATPHTQRMYFQPYQTTLSFSPVQRKITTSTTTTTTTILYDTVDMCHVDERMKTFVKWPITFLSAEQLARNGFYYLGHGDEVRCAFCKLEIMRWHEGDDPAKVHQRWAPLCPFVRQLTGLNSVGSRQCWSLRAGDTTPHLLYPAYPYYDLQSARLRSFQHWPQCNPQQPEDLAEAGLFYTGEADITQCFYCGGCLKDWKSDEEPWEKHARWFDHCSYVFINKGQDYIETVLTKFAIMATRVKNKVPSETTSMLSPKNFLENDKLCKVCYSKDRNVYFMPCGHVVVCAECASTIDICPRCCKKVTFQRVVRIHFP